MRALETPLTMAVLALLRERPRHPYEMQALLRERDVGAVVKLRGGSLYDAVGRLHRAGLIAPHDRERAGARPERTVYALTGDGDDLLDRLVRRFLGTVTPEFPAFPAGLAHLLLLGRDEAVTLLRQRRRALTVLAERAEATLAAGVTVVLIEADHARTLLRAEIDWLDRTVAAIETGTLPWTAPSSEEA